MSVGTSIEFLADNSAELETPEHCMLILISIACQKGRKGCEAACVFLRGKFVERYIFQSNHVRLQGEQEIMSYILTEIDIEFPT